MNSKQLLRHGNRLGTQLRRHEAFTLVELTVGLVILGVAVFFTMGPLVSTFGVLVSASETRDLWDEGAAALRRIAVEVRDAESVKTVSGNNARLTIDKAHPANDGYETVIFFADDTYLYREGKNEGVETILAGNVADFSVTFDADGNDILLIEIQMMGSDGETFTMKTKVCPMNLKNSDIKSFYNKDDKSGDWQIVIDSGKGS